MIDFVNNDNGTNAAAALTTDTSTYVMADGAITLTGIYGNNGSHGLITNSANSKVSYDLTGSSSDTDTTAMLYDTTSETPDVAVIDDIKFSTKGEEGATCTTQSVEYTMAEAGTLILALSHVEL